MSNGRNAGRTVVLSLAVALSLAILIVVALLVFRDSESTDTGAATTTVTSSVGASTTSSTTSSTPPPESTRTRPTGEPGTVTYQFTGSGEVIGASYRSGRSMQVVAITGTPWQQKTTVDDRSARLTGIVIRGRITCTITQGEELLASSTSSGGPISCTATLPR